MKVGASYDFRAASSPVDHVWCSFYAYGLWQSSFGGICYLLIWMKLFLTVSKHDHAYFLWGMVGWGMVGCIARLCKHVCTTVFYICITLYIIILCGSPSTKTIFGWVGEGWSVWDTVALSLIPGPAVTTVHNTWHLYCLISYVQVASWRRHRKCSITVTHVLVGG